MKKQVATLRRQVTELQSDKSSLQADTSSFKQKLEAAERSKGILQQNVTRAEEERKRAVDTLEMMQKLYRSEVTATTAGNGTATAPPGHDDGRPSFLVGPDMPDEGMYNTAGKPIPAQRYGEPDHDGSGCCSTRKGRGICSTGGGGCSLM